LGEHAQQDNATALWFGAAENHLRWLLRQEGYPSLAKSGQANFKIPNSSVKIISE
jgi:hypothetical protein